MRYFVMTISIVLIIVCCKTNTKAHVNTFRVLLPDSAKTHISNTLFDDLKELSGKLNLPRMDTGVAGFELRLWIKIKGESERIILFRKTDTAMLSKKIEFYVSPYSVDHFEISIDKPGKSSLQLLSDSLKQIDFVNLLSQDEIKNFDTRYADSTRYHLEISTPQYYKLVSYQCPERFATTEPNNKKFSGIILLLDRYLHLMR